MSAILRTPTIVPSLFARGVEGEAPVQHRAPLLKRLRDGVSRVGDWTDRDVEASAACHAVSRLCGVVMLAFVARPLARAAMLAVGLGAPP